VPRSLLLLALFLCACRGTPAPRDDADPRATLARRLHDEGLIANPVVRDSVTIRAARAHAAGRNADASAREVLAWLAAWEARNPEAARRRDSAVDPRRATSPFRAPAVPDSIRDHIRRQSAAIRATATP
jgi:hypothetical protein